ncbi:aldo/keto reductase [Tessaracoccus sp.]
MTIPLPPGTSPLVLGTVQLGGSYGIANRTGVPDHASALSMVAAALEGGVITFDTAASYGDSEKVLGQCLAELGVAGETVVVTKTRPLSDHELGNPAAARAAIEASVAESRRRLQRDTIPVVLFHREADAVHLDALLELRDRGWITHAGVSCDVLPEPVIDFSSAPGVQAVQIPASVLDRRHQLGGSFAHTLDQSVTVFVRSIFLQGLLLMPECSIPEHLAPAIPARRALTRVSAESGMSLAELAVRYVLGLPGDVRPVLGAETVEQVRENVSLAAGGPLPHDVMAAVDEAVGVLPEAVISPRLWT